MSREAYKIRITVLSDNHVVKPSQLLGEWGLALLLDIEHSHGKTRILYDTGQTGIVLKNNMDVLNIDVNSIEYIVLSHGHYDHTGGLPKMLELTRIKPTLIVHPAAFERKIVIREGMMKYIGIPYSRSLLEEKTWLIETRDPIDIAPGVIFSGEITRYGYPEYTPDMYVLHEGRLIKDHMPDDAALIVNLRDKGLVIVTGCGHAGILNIIEHAFTVMGLRKLYAVIGGLHLEREPRDKILELAKKFKELDVKLVVPLHCTGQIARIALREVLGEHVLMGGVGTIIEL